MPPSWPLRRPGPTGRTPPTKSSGTTTARLRGALGEEEFERACMIGKGLSLEQACDLALGKTNPR